MLPVGCVVRYWSNGPARATVGNWGRVCWSSVGGSWCPPGGPWSRRRVSCLLSAWRPPVGAVGRPGAVVPPVLCAGRAGLCGGLCCCDGLLCCCRCCAPGRLLGAAADRWRVSWPVCRGPAMVQRGRGCLRAASAAMDRGGRGLLSYCGVLLPFGSLPQPHSTFSGGLEGDLAQIHARG